MVSTYLCVFLLPPPSSPPQDSSAISLSVGPVTVSGYMVALAILAVYVPGAPFMYMNMVSNRKSAFKKRNAGVGDSKKTA